MYVPMVNRELWGSWSFLEKA